MTNSRIRGLALVGALALGSVATVAQAPAAQAQTNLGTCQGGTWGSVWGWGDCQGGSPNAHHRLVLSCTWGQSARSSWFTNGHVDIKCPSGSARSTWFETATW